MNDFNDIDKYLNELGLSRSIKTFTTNMQDYWHWLPIRSKELEIDSLPVDLGNQNIFDRDDQSRPLKRLNYIFNEFIGDFLNLLGGSWIVTGTARGTKQYGSDSPFGSVESPFIIKYNAESDSLEYRLGCLWTCSNISSPDSPIQMESDVNVPKIVLVARKNIDFGCGKYSINNYFILSP